jgi:hypothetical protein
LLNQTSSKVVGKGIDIKWVLYNQPSNPGHCHGLRINFNRNTQLYWDNQTRGFSAFEVKFFQGSLIVLRSSIGGLVDAVRTYPPIGGSFHNDTALFDEPSLFEYRKDKNPKLAFDEIAGVIENPQL